MASAAKIALMQAAAVLAAGVATRLGQQALSITGDGKLSPDVQAQDLAVWNVFTVFYDALRRAADATVFIEPQGATADPASALAGLVSQITAGKAGPLITALEAALGLTQAAPAPVPAPGANLPPAPATTATAGH